MPATRDYARFLQMLLNGGALDGVRLLSPASVALMTSNHVGALCAGGDTGFGPGFEVVEHVGCAGKLSSVGESGWGEEVNTNFDTLDARLYSSHPGIQWVTSRAGVGDDAAHSSTRSTRATSAARSTSCG